MRNNLIFNGIPEHTADNPENAIEDFTQTALKLSLDTISKITFHRVHRIGAKINCKGRPRPIVAKLNTINKRNYPIICICSMFTVFIFYVLSIPSM